LSIATIRTDGGMPINCGPVRCHFRILLRDGVSLFPGGDARRGLKIAW